MTPLDRLGGAELRSIMEAYRGALEEHRQAINRLNVYPVPDGDTGTNMALTVEAVVQELRGAGADLATTCKAIGHGALMGARGNSGVVLSQILRDLGSAFAEAGTVDGAVMARALGAAADGAYRAVANPVEGTILTVARAAAEGAAGPAGGGADLAEVLEGARRAAAEALARTPELLAVLAEAGVVDAGGAGLLLLFDAALHVVAGRALPEPDPATGPVPAVAQPAGEEGEPIEARSGPRYEVTYLLAAPDESISAFREGWATVGESIVVVGGEGTWSCHIHTDDIGASLETALDHGRPSRIRVADLHQEVVEERWVREALADEAGEPRADSLTTSTTEVVAVAAGEGLGRLLRSLGVSAVVAGGQAANPSTAELLAAVDAVEAPEVVLLPNNANVVPVAERVDGLSAKRVRVVPTRRACEGMAAVLAHDPHGGADENVVAMAKAAAAVVAGEVTQAVRDATTTAGPVAAGDWLGIGPEGIAVVASGVVEAATALVAALAGGEHELVTLVEGEGATGEHTERLLAWLAEHHPGLEVEVHRGDQPHYPYLVGLE